MNRAHRDVDNQTLPDWLRRFKCFFESHQVLCFDAYGRSLGRGIVVQDSER